MRKVIVSIFVSLDGYIADANGELGWTTSGEDMERYSLDILNSVDAILLGRKTYQLFLSYWPTASDPGAEQINTLPKIVFSRTLDKVEWGQWNNARLVKDNIAEEVAKLKQQPGKDLVIFAGAGIINTFRKLDLIDEYRLLLHPVVLGSGTPLFEDVEAALKLTLLRTEPFGDGVVVLYYAPEQQ